jgi:NAD(P)-dependent dehydrogenase (short-subunit alcohol dehydrogenase family)
MHELSPKRALVTGGTSGIGRATAQALAREGAHVLISGRSEARGAEVVAAIEADGGEAEFVRADLKSPDDVRALAERAANVDIFVNNAGVFPGGPTHDLPGGDLRRDVCRQCQGPVPIDRGDRAEDGRPRRRHDHQRHHMVAEFGMAGLSAYGASKAAVALLTKAWAAEYGPKASASTRSRPARRTPRALKRRAKASPPSCRPSPRPRRRPGEHRRDDRLLASDKAS